MIKKFLGVILILLIAVSTVHALEEGVTVPVVAYHSAGDEETGLLLSARVVAANGSGHVFVDTSPYTQVDLQGSARLAAMVSTDVLGIDQRSYDFYYIIDISSPILGGPSAGSALTVATIATINNWTLKPGVVMTGTINPDESIGPVGGIPFKLEAAAASNTTLFLIPEGQREVISKKTVARTRGAFIVYETEEETVDLIEMGNELNITVREVSTIQDAVKAFTGHEIEKTTYQGNILTPGYLDLLEPFATRLKKESFEMYDETSKITSGGQFLEQAKDIIERADNMYKDEKYYAATSLYFNSMINMRFVQWDNIYKNSGDKEQYLIELLERTEKQIQLSETDLDNFKSGGIIDVEAVGAAESRITAARARLDDAKELEDPEEKIFSLAFAHERARTAQWWLTLSTPDGRAIPEAILKDRAGWYLSQAQSINTYTLALISESGGHPEITGSGRESLENAQVQMKRGYYSGVIFDSLQATVRSSTTIGLLGTVDASKKIEQSATAAKAAINEARLVGIEPTLAVSAYEYGETLTNTFDQVNQYLYAKMIAKTVIVLNSYSVPTNNTPVKPTLTPFIRDEQFGITPDTTGNKQKTEIEVPGFEAIPALTAIFVLRRLFKN